MATTPQSDNAAIEILHVYNCNTSKAVELKTRAELEYWSGLVLGGPGGRRLPVEDLSHKYPSVENFYKAIVKEPGTGYTFNVYFIDSAVEKRLDAKRAAMFGCC